MPSASSPTTTYAERQIGNTLYRISTTYKNELDFKQTLENLIVQKILSEENHGKK